MAFRDRFFTPQVARAIMSPSGIVLAGAGAAAAILAAGVGPLALVAGAAAWAARVAVAIPRGGPKEIVDPSRVGEPWRRLVQDAQRAKRRFDETADRCRPGPIRERLHTIGERVEDAVTECWRVARRGHELDQALQGLDERAMRAELEEVHEERRRSRGDDAADGALYRTQQAIESQLAATDRLRALARDVQNRLRLLNAQLDELVARTVEISVQATDEGQLGGLTSEVENVVGELEALRAGIEETAGVAHGTGGTAVAGTS